MAKKKPAKEQVVASPGPDPQTGHKPKKPKTADAPPGRQRTDSEPFDPFGLDSGPDSTDHPSQPKDESDGTPASSAAEEPDPDLLRAFLPTAVASAGALCDLTDTRRNYPDVLEHADARTMHHQLVYHLELAIEATEIPRIHDIYGRPDFEDLEAGERMGWFSRCLAVYHPEAGVELKNLGKAHQRVTEMCERCEEVAIEPVRRIIARLTDTMRRHCRNPNPANDPSFTEPKRFIQMLRMYWPLCHGIVASEINSLHAPRPHHLQDLIVNLKDRILRCCDALAGQQEIPDERQTIINLLDALLLGDEDEVVAVVEWRVQQLQQVRNDIETLCLKLGGVMLPLTHAEVSFLQWAKKRVVEYAAYCKNCWTANRKNMDRLAAEIRASTHPLSAETIFSQPAEPVKPESQPGVSATGAKNRVPGGKKKDEVAKKPWTQPDLDEAILEYKAKRASTFKDLVEGAKRAKPGAKKSAQALFGRNAIWRALGVKSKAMVSSSTVWQDIADELGIPRGPRKSGHPRKQWIGMDPALEEQAVASGESAFDEVVRRETIALVEKSMPAAEAEATIEKLQRGEITDDQAHEISEALADPEQG